MKGDSPPAGTSEIIQKLLEDDMHVDTWYMLVHNQPIHGLGGGFNPFEKYLKG